MLRLFVAIPLPERVRERLVALRTGLAGARWTHPENHHLTLRFLGDTPEERLPLLQQALSSIAFAPLAIELDRLGTFPGLRRPRVLFARAAPSTELLSLQQQVEAAVQRSGFEEADKPFRPHVTLARLRRPDPHAVRRVLQAAELDERFEAEEFVLFASRLRPDRAVHEAMARFRSPGRSV